MFSSRNTFFLFLSTLALTLSATLAAGTRGHRATQISGPPDDNWEFLLQNACSELPDMTINCKSNCFQSPPKNPAVDLEFEIEFNTKTGSLKTWHLKEVTVAANSATKPYEKFVVSEGVSVAPGKGAVVQYDIASNEVAGNAVALMVTASFESETGNSGCQVHATYDSRP